MLKGMESCALMSSISSLAINLKLTSSNNIKTSSILLNPNFLSSLGSIIIQEYFADNSLYLATNPALADVLMNCGMHCLGCPASQEETIEEACSVHGIDVEEILKLLNA